MPEPFRFRLTMLRLAARTPILVTVTVRRFDNLRYRGHALTPMLRYPPSSAASSAARQSFCS
jgi:hypothetical protein